MGLDFKHHVWRFNFGSQLKPFKVIRLFYGGLHDCGKVTSWTMVVIFQAGVGSEECKHVE